MNIGSLVYGSIKKMIKNKQNQIFALFLLFSFLSWMMIKLSNDYDAKISFHVEYKHLSKRLRFKSPPPSVVKAVVKIRGSQIFKYRFFRRTIHIDLSNVRKNNKRLFISASAYQNEIRNFLDNDENVILKSIIPDTLFFDMDTLYTRKIKVKPIVKLNLKKGFQIDDGVVSTPLEVQVTGQKNILDTLKVVKTLTLMKNKLDADFSNEIDLETIPEVFFDVQKVVLYGSVYKTTEEVLNVSIDIIHKPQNSSIKIFPKEIQVLCRGSINRIKDIKEGDLKVVFDYDKYIKGIEDYVPEIIQHPKKIEVKSLFTDRIDVLIRK